MNYLFHLFLSDPDPEVQLGNLMGDFVKGPLDATAYPAAILHGLRQHRRVDSFATYSVAYQSSRQRIDTDYGYFRSIMVDVFYDHLLACRWEQYHHQPLEQFADQIYRLLEANFDRLPAGLQQVVPRMVTHNWLVSYRRTEIVDRVLHRLDQRISRATPLAGGGEQLQRHYAKLDADCARFIIEAQQFLAGDRG